MEQWTFTLAAFGITALAIGGYILVLRARTRAAEHQLRDTSSDNQADTR